MAALNKQQEIQKYETMALRFLESQPEKLVVDSTFKNEKVPGFESLSIEDIRALLKKLAAEDRMDQVLGQGVTMYRHKRVGGGPIPAPLRGTEIFDTFQDPRPV